MKNEYCTINNVEMGKRIREARKKAHLTQLELANMINVSDVAVSRYENAQATPRLKALVGIATVTQTPIERFFDIPYRENSMNEYNAALHEINELCLSFSLDDLKYIITFLQRISNPKK